MLNQAGIAISLTAGRFQSLTDLLPELCSLLYPAISKLPYSRSVDNFKTATYDLSYKPSKQGQLSTTLRLSYEDGTTIDVSLWDISDNIDFAWANAIGQGYVGPGGRVFPSRLSRNTTPRLWAEKQKAVAAMNAYNEDFELFVSIGLAGVMSNLPMGPVAGEAPVDPVTPRAPQPSDQVAPPKPPEPATPPKPLEPGPQPPKQLKPGPPPLKQLPPGPQAPKTDCRLKPSPPGGCKTHRSRSGRCSNCRPTANPGSLNHKRHGVGSGKGPGFPGRQRLHRKTG